MKACVSTTHRQSPSEGDEATADVLREQELHAAETVGNLMEFWGFKRPMGRIWTLLFLSPEPLSAGELGERLSMSAGAVSMALAELAKWGAVRRTWRPGERRDFYEAEASIWKLVTKVFRERELELVREAGGTFGSAAEALVRAAKGAERDRQKRLQFARERLQKLKSWARLGEMMLSTVVSGGRLDTTAMREFDQDEAKNP